MDLSFLSGQYSDGVILNHVFSSIKDIFSFDAAIQLSFLEEDQQTISISRMKEIIRIRSDLIEKEILSNEDKLLFCSNTSS